MRNNRPQPCKCGHPKSIHAHMYFQARPAKLPKGCNFPGCKCNNYRAAQILSPPPAA